MSKTTSPQQTLEQQRAAHAWKKVQAVSQRQKEFRSLAMSLPADIQANGLGQTLAFLAAKKEEEHKQALAAITEWVKHRLNITESDFIQWLMTEATSEEYRRATAEAIAYAIWLKRFAEARF